MAKVNLGQANWIYESGSGYANQFRTQFDVAKFQGDGYCSHYALQKIAAYNNLADKHFSFTNSQVPLFLRIKDTSYSDAETFKAAMSGVELVYELATPLTYQCTPKEVTAILGLNNIWADTGDVSLEYLEQGVLTEEYAKYEEERIPQIATKMFSNDNLLDNGWWLNPINQRSATNLPSGSYGIDRWKGEHTSGTASVTVTSNGLVFEPAGGTANAWQPLEASLRAWMVGKKITVSILKGDGTIISGTDTYTSGTSTYFITRPQSGGVECFISPGGNLNCRAASSYTIAAIKMELGSVSTLANDAPPDYWQELDKCLYYFERITNNGSSPITIGAGFADGVNNLYVPVHIHRKRAGIATISTSGAIYTGQQSSNIVVSSVSQYNSSPDGIITLLANAPSSFTSNGYYRLALGAGAHIDFSADL